MSSDTQLSQPANPLDALLRQLTRAPEPIVGQWATALLAGDAAAIPLFAGWSWGKRAVWLKYVPPLDPPSEGDPLSDDVFLRERT